MHGLLFSEHGPLSAYLAELEQLADRLVDEMPEGELVDRPPREHVCALERQLMPQVPDLLLDRVAPRREVVAGEAFIVFTIPFSGTAALFGYSPQASVGDLPRGAVFGALTVSVPMTDRDSDAIEEAYRTTVEQIAKNLRALGDELAPFAASLSGRLMTRLTARWNRVVKERAVADEVLRRFCSANGS